MVLFFRYVTQFVRSNNERRRIILTMTSLHNIISISIRFSSFVRIMKSFTREWIFSGFSFGFSFLGQITLKLEIISFFLAFELILVSNKFSLLLFREWIRLGFLLRKVFWHTKRRRAKFVRFQLIGFRCSGILVHLRTWRLEFVKVSFCSIRSTAASPKKKGFCVLFTPLRDGIY